MTQGPRDLIAWSDLGPISEKIASEIVSDGDVSLLSLAELTSILSSALRLTLTPPPPPPERPWDFTRSHYLPDGTSDWEDIAVIGIGYFDHEGHQAPIEVNRRCRSGLGVETRRLDDFDGRYSNFYVFVMMKTERRGTRDEYLRVWLDPHLPPRIAFLDSAPTMSLEGELYEILNTRIEQRGLIPSFEYDTIRHTFEKSNRHDSRFSNARRGSRHVARAISEGLRGEDLLPALYVDFRCWQSMRPDIWPSPPSKPFAPLFVQYSYSSSSINPFRQLPTELFLEILYHLPIPSILSLSSTSQALRMHITEPTFLNQVIKIAVLSGTEFWILPVAGVRGEKERAARKTIVKWLPSAEASETPATETPFLSPSFPYLAFLHACYASDSMRSRQRLWRIVKQFDLLWKDYRLNGWERDDVLTFEPYIPPSM